MTDFTEWVKAGHSRSQFDDLIDEARLKPIYLLEGERGLPETGLRVTLTESQDAANDGKPIEMSPLVVVGKQEPAYSVPKRVEFRCDQEKGSACKKCPMHTLYNGEHIKEYKANHDIPRDSIDATDEQVNKMLRTDIRARCSDHLEMVVAEKWNVEELMVSESVETRTQFDAVSDIVRSVYNFGTYNTPVNVTVKIVGEQVSSRKDQRGQLFSWHLEQVESSIESFRMTPELHDQMKVYQVQPGETVADRLHAMAEDNAHHVTRIFGRPELHTAVRITFTSLLQVPFLGKPIKGYLSGAIPGDSRTGKSLVCSSLVDHWRVGMLINCEQATQAGLIGGVQQFNGNMWMVSWGLGPQNDRRALIFDEAGSLGEKEIIEAMSSIRSSGVAELVKIRSARTPARYREIFVFNSPSGTQIAALQEGGMQATRELFTKHEDIARLDWVLAVGKAEVDGHVVNSRHDDDAPPHVYTSDLENAMMLWCWSRKADDVRWAKGVEDYILAIASRVGERYSANFPLLQTENAKEKFARGAVAVAAAVFSTSNGEDVVVRKAHVDTYVRFLDDIYSRELMGYRRMSIKHARDERESVQNVDVVRDYLRENGKVSGGAAIYHGLTSLGGNFDTRSFAETAAISLDDAMDGLRWLEDRKMIRRIRGGKLLEPLPALTKLLRDMQDEDNQETGSA